MNDIKTPVVVVVIVVVEVVVVTKVWAQYLLIRSVKFVVTLAIDSFRTPRNTN